MPLGGLVPMFLMQLGEVTPGGVGSGLYTIVVFALLSVFVAGLMVGRTPEYLGKKVQAKEIKLAMLAVLILTVFILGGAGISLVLPNGVSSLANAGPHGLSEMLYAWSSATENNGSAMAGLTADTPLLDYGLGAAMMLRPVRLHDPGSGDCRLAGRQSRNCRPARVPFRPRAAVRGPADGRDHHPGRPAIHAGGRARADRGALHHARGQDVLTHERERKGLLF
jgi:hypothetical protein